MILQEILLLISGFKRVQQKDFHIGRICTTMSSFFLCCKTKTVIWQIRKKTKELLFIAFWEKNTKKRILSCETFLLLWMRNWCKQRVEKNYNTVYLNKNFSQENYCFH